MSFLTIPHIFEVEQNLIPCPRLAGGYLPQVILPTGDALGQLAAAGGVRSDIHDRQ